MSRARRIQVLTTLALLAVLGVVLAIALGGGDDEPQVTVPAVAQPAQAPASGMTIGNPSAPEVEEFIDPQCPFCAMFARQVLPGLMTDYVQAGRIKLTLRPLAFLGEDSVPAARAVAAAGLQDKAWDYMEVFFANQGRENSGYVTDGFLREVGSQVEGLDVDQLMDDRDSAAVTRVLDAAEARAEEVGVDSTPSFVLTVEGELRKVESNLEPGPFRENLDAALAGS